ncbi:MAG: helix-turn-helix transcriptional regulator [Thermomicrobiales bacterium]|nr:helix-turn-helix transcriptional regulator [Thermomicrobiales bacterium]
MKQNFGAYARERRVLANKVMRDVAKAVGMSSVYISDIERGNRNPPSSAVLRQWAAVISVDPDEFEDLALLERESVELRVGGNRSHTKDEIALVLARAWDDLSDDEEEGLRQALASRLVGKG